MSLAAIAVRRPVATVAATLAVCLLGAVSLGRTPVTLLPDVTLPVLTIRTQYPGAAAEEAARFVAEPIENAVSATPGLVELRSVARPGEVVTTLRFGWGTEMETTVLTVRERLDAARGQLPERAGRPTLLTADPGQRPIAVLALTGPRDLAALARTAEEVHARRLEGIPGVASVAVVGAPEEEIRVEADPERLRALGLTPQDLATALQAANAVGQGGTVRRGQFRFPVRTLAEFRSTAEIGAVPVGPAGAGITVGDVATVTRTLADPRTLTRLDGGPAIGLVVYKDAGANTVAVTRELLRGKDELEREFAGIAMTVVAAQARFVTDALANLGQEIVLGGALSLLVILLFLQQWRPSLAIGVMVPLSVLVALIVLRWLDVTVNVLSLGGLALGVGLLVDNAIVVAEAVGRKREDGVGVVEAAIAGTEEVTAPLVAGTLTTVLVFGPIVFVRGLAAALFRDLSLSVVASVGASLVLALTVMPVLIAGFRRDHGDSVPPAAAPGPARRVGWLAGIDRAGARLAGWYEDGMRWALRHPAPVLGAGLAVMLVTAGLAWALPKEILPRVDEGIVVVQLRLPEGTAIEETARQVARVEEAARTFGARGLYARVGVATDEEILAGADPGTSATAQLLVPVPAGADAAAFAQRLRGAVPDLAAGALALDLAGQSEFGSLIGREGRLVRVEVTAGDLAAARAWADTVGARMRGLATLSDVRAADAGTQPLVEVELHRERLADRGISIPEVASALAGALGGVHATDFRETDRRTPVQVRFAAAANEDLAAALASTVRGVPVGQLVRVRETRAPLEVVRVDQRPVAVVEGLIEAGGTARAARDVAALLAGLTPPPGVTWRVTGADAEQRRTTNELTLVAVLSVVLVFLVLAGEFASFTIPLTVMLTVPLAAAGALILLWLTGQSLNAVSLIGIVVMIGMADNEAVVKLDAIRRFRERGHAVDDAVLLGGRQRLRAIAMTSITTIAGVLPLAFGWGSGGELYRPLAAAVIGGSLSALLVTFFLLPTAYAVLERRGGRRAAR